MDSDGIVRTWAELVDADRPTHRLLDGHPLHLYYGSDGTRPMFFLISPIEPHPPHVGELIQLDVRRRVDGRWTTTLTLRDPAYTASFMSICVELARRTADATSDAQGAALFDRTLAQWQKLLAQLSLQKLSKEQIRGLFAELSFGLGLAQRTSLRDMVLAWEGPRGAAQDFRHPTAGYFEVKAVGMDAREVRISSVAQLDPEDGTDVVLAAAVVVADEMGKDPQSLSLSELIGQIRRHLAGDGALLDAFDDRLASAGVDIADPSYAELRLRVHRWSGFRTAEGFPRLRRATIPAGVDAVKYRISFTALAPFEIDSSWFQAGTEEPAGLRETGVPL